MSVRHIVKKKFKQNSEDGRSGLGVLKQIEKQKPKSFHVLDRYILVPNYP